MVRFRTWFLMALVLLGASSRLVPHPPNFTPLAAIALFGGAAFASRRAAFLVPLGALVLSDLVLHLTYCMGWQPARGFSAEQWAVYGSLLATVLIGRLIRGRRNVLVIAGAAVAGSLLFFFVTNFAVWAAGTIYPRTPRGLLLCYEMGVPFYRLTLAGDLVYCTCLFGSLALAEAGFPVLRQPAVRAGETV